MIPIVRAILRQLSSMRIILQLLDEKFSQDNENVFLNYKDVDKINGLLDEWEKSIKSFNLNESLKLVKHIKFEFALLEIAKKVDKLEFAPMKVYTAKHLIKELERRVDDELNNIVFGYIPFNKVSYFGKENLFGKEVFDNFPSAQEDIKSAGNCFAHNQNTACVFHLMRAVEVGAKAMVRAMKAQKHIGVYVSVRGVRTFKKKPIELCDWKTLRDGLKTALNELEKGSSISAKKKATLAFYSHAIAQFGYFKDAWRNNISHGNEIAPNRKFYLAGETKDIMDNTRHFLQHLAKRIKE